jgi:hypothetical protein
MKKLAAIYERKGALFVLASHRTEAGFWVDDEQVISLTQPTDDELGRAIEQALAHSKNGMPTPPPTARIDKPLLTAAGVGSWSTFMKLSRHVSVSIDDGAWKATPHRNLGKGGFEPEAGFVIDRTAAPQLGRLVMDLLNRTSD